MFREKMVMFRKLIFCSILFFAWLVSLKAVSPQEIRLERASYRKITISWQAPDATTQIAYYKIYRDGTELATTTTLNYTDDTVQPGIKYVYKVLAVIVGGGNSEFSSELPVWTLKSASYENSHLVDTVVDAFRETPITLSPLLINNLTISKPNPLESPVINIILSFFFIIITLNIIFN